jgi:hypothetical protein
VADPSRVSAVAFDSEELVALLLIMVRCLAMACCLVLVASVVPVPKEQEEINRQGRIVMEQRRMERGAWVHVLRQSDMNFIQNHVGAGGFAVVGFFVGDTYKGEDHREASRHQGSDELFLGYVVHCSSQ